MDAGSETISFPNIAVLASGSGTNFQAIIDDGIKVKVLLVDNPHAKAIERAQSAGIAVEIIDRKKDFVNDRKNFTDEIISRLVKYNIELVVFAGFMSILTDQFFEKYENRVLNTHPSLLPAFTGTYGKNTVQATLDAGVKVTGCTIHIATAEVDAGPILAQEPVEVLDNDDVDTLQERIKKVEHRLYPQTIRQFCVELNERQ